MNPLQHILIFAVRGYRWTLSPAKVFLFGPSCGCRFEPSCSAYAIEVVREHGALAGSWLALKRICRCHPWGHCGHDPVPRRKSEIRSLKSEPRRPEDGWSAAEAREASVLRAPRSVLGR